MTEEILQTEYVKEENKMMEICPIDALVLVVKFESDICDGFQKSAVKFTQLFGTLSKQSYRK